MTKSDAIETMLRWLDEATINGQETPADQLADLKQRAAYLLDGAVKYIAGHFKIPAVYSVVRAPVKNLLGDGFGMYSGIPPDKYEKETNGGKSFYIEICGSCNITITEGNTTLYSDEISSPNVFTAVKKNIAGASGGRIKLTIASDYPFVIRNAAIFPCAFSSDGSIQDYIPYVPYKMPDNFREFESLLQTSGDHQYRRFKDFRREGTDIFLLPYYAEGQFDFRYWRNPADISPLAPGSTEIEVESHAAQLIPLKLAVDVCLGSEELSAIGRVLDAKFQNMMVNLMTEDVDSNFIETVYSMV